MLTHDACQVRGASLRVVLRCRSQRPRFSSARLRPQTTQACRITGSCLAERAHGTGSSAPLSLLKPVTDRTGFESGDLSVRTGRAYARPMSGVPSAGLRGASAVLVSPAPLEALRPLSGRPSCWADDRGAGVPANLGVMPGDIRHPVWRLMTLRLAGSPDYRGSSSVGGPDYWGALLDGAFERGLGGAPPPCRSCRRLGFPSAGRIRGPNRR